MNDHAGSIDARSGANDVRERGRWTTGQRLKNDLLYWLIRALLAIVARAPKPALAAVARAIALLAWAFAPGLRRRVRARLEAGLGGEVPSTRVRAAFRASAESIVSSLALVDPRERSRASMAEGSAAVFREALDEGRGVVFVTAHLGPWERLAAGLVESGFPVATVARESYDPRLTEVVYERIRRPRGVVSIYRGRSGAATAILRELRKGRAIGFLIDLPARVPSAGAIIFGRDTRIPIGAARIALARRAAVVVGTLEPGPSGALRIRIERLPIERFAGVPEGEHALTRALADALSRRIEAWPEAWLGLFTPHPRA